MAKLIITAIGPDRPGIVGELAGHLHAAGANLLDSRMVNLRGQFALLVLLEASADAITALERALAGIGDAMGLRVSTSEVSDPPAPREGLPFRLKTYSMDRPGIVHGVADVLRKHGVNIEELETRQESGAFVGASVFTLEARLTVPLEVPVRRLRQELEALCDTLNCDVDLDAV